MDYTRALHEILDKAGVENKPENRRMLDDAVREVLGEERADAESVSRKVQAILSNEENRKAFEQEVTSKLIKKVVLG